MDRAADGVDADAAGSLAELAVIDGIAIAEQMAWFLAPGCRLDDLPPHPGSRGAGGHVDMHQLTPTMSNEHQHVQCLERQRLNREQISGPEMMSMVAQDREWRSRVSRQGGCARPIAALV